jgi:hypothetical protein
LPCGTRQKKAYTTTIEETYHFGNGERVEVLVKKWLSFVLLVAISSPGSGSDSLPCMRRMKGTFGSG